MSYRCAEGKVGIKRNMLRHGLDKDLYVIFANLAVKNKIIIK